MPFTQGNDVIEAFTPDRSDDAFRQGDLGAVRTSLILIA
jgi:hypothetical protein